PDHLPVGTWVIGVRFWVLGGRSHLAAPITHHHRQRPTYSMAGALAKRSAITRTASGLLSTSRKRRPSSMQAAPVVPLPAKKSATSPPGGDDACTIRRRMPSGFW